MFFLFHFAVQNFFLYFYGAVFNFMFLCGTSWVKKQTWVDMFANQSTVTHILIANNAAQVGAYLGVL